MIAITFAGKNTTYGNLTVSKVNSVYDGDTFRADIKGVPPILGENIAIRLYGIDTPEMRDKRPHIKKKAIEARDYVRTRLFKAKKIELRNIRRGKYFRIVATVVVDGKDIGKELIAMGLAQPYGGGKKSIWR